MQMEALAGCFAPLTAGPGTTAACHAASDIELACGLTAARARFARFRCEER
ncbi:hypothetical protein JMJ92_20680, partial [Rhodovulum visakhapatnamense]|nr:hypothetical protein [Rhodovulum visakhapatnamense]